MKRTLKRGLKVREIAKREGIRLSMGMSPNRVSWGYLLRGLWRGLVYTWFIHGFMKLPSVHYFWDVLVSIGSLESVTEKLGHGRPPAGG